MNTGHLLILNARADVLDLPLNEIKQLFPNSSFSCHKLYLKLSLNGSMLFPKFCVQEFFFFDIQVLNMLCCWVDDPDSEAFKLHLPRISDYLWIAEDGMKLQVCSYLIKKNLIEKNTGSMLKTFLFICFLITTMILGV